MFEAILIVLHQLPVFYEDLEEKNRENRLETIALAIDTSSRWLTCDSGRWAGCKRRWALSRRTLVALQVATASRESALSARIHAGRCYPTECDRGRARGLWQVHQSGPITVEWWAGMAGHGYRETFAAAFAAGYLFSLNERRCKGIDGAISAYASGSCYWAGIKKRKKHYHKILRMLKLASSK